MIKVGMIEVTLDKFEAMLPMSLQKTFSAAGGGTMGTSMGVATDFRVEMSLAMVLVMVTLAWQMDLDWLNSKVSTLKP